MEKSNFQKDIKMQEESRERFLYEGIGILKTLPRVLQEIGVNKAVIVTSKSVIKTSAYDKVQESISSVTQSVYSTVRANVPNESVNEVISILQDIKPDAIISIGGGSAIDTVKAALSLGAQDAMHVTIPTTLASAECTDIFGVVKEGGVKKVYDAYKNGPTHIFYDAEMTGETPDELWFSTALRTLDHALERFYSLASTIENDEQCIEALRLLSVYLPQNIQNVDDLQSRQNLLRASWLSMSGQSMTCISHAIAHQIRSMSNNILQDVVAVTQPSVLAYNKEYCTDALKGIATALGEDVTYMSQSQIADIAIESVKRLIVDVTDIIDMPKGLHELGISNDDVHTLAEVLMHSPRLRYNPRPINTKEEMYSLLMRMY